jgi:hypothetical protein
MFLEIAPNHFVNTAQIVQFKLLHSPERGGYVWVFTLSAGKILSSIPFKNEEEALQWLIRSLKGLQCLESGLKELHKGYRAE